MKFNDLDLENKTVVSQLGWVPTSVWDFPKTQTLTTYVDDNLGEGTYGVKEDIIGGRLSQFNPKIAEKILKIWSAKDDWVLDPFSGRTRALMARLLERNYVGYELSRAVCEQLRQNITRSRLEQHRLTPEIRNEDARNINENEKYDLIFSCPPYWDVEDYNKLYGENNPGQLSDLKDYRAFLAGYEEIIAKCHAALKPGKFAVWVVADIRREKELIPFGFHSIVAFQKAGFKLNDIIISKLNSPSVVGVANFLRHGYTPKCHEYILVFKKAGG